VLGLTASGVVVQESEEETITSSMVTGIKQLVMCIQGEYVFNVGCTGFKWDVTNGGANPTDTALGTTTNWDKAMAEDKNLGWRPIWRNPAPFIPDQVEKFDLVLHYGMQGRGPDLVKAYGRAGIPVVIIDFGYLKRGSTDDLRPEETRGFTPPCWLNIQGRRTLRRNRPRLDQAVRSKPLVRLRLGLRRG